MDETQPPDRRPLSRALVIERALSLADADGLDAVTIRRLAKDLGVTPMALYWHFRNKNELLGGMVEWIYATFDGTVDGAAPWQEQFRSFLNQLIAVLRAHPAAATLLQTRDTYSESSLRVNETALDILHRAGLSPFEAARTMRHAVAMAVGVAIDAASVANRPPMQQDEREPAGLLAAQPAQRYPLEATRIIQRRADEAEAAKGIDPADPSARYPRIIEAAAAIGAHQDADAYSTFAIDLLEGGITAIAARRTSESTTTAPDTR